MISLKNTSCRFAWARYLHCPPLRGRRSTAGEGGSGPAALPARAGACDDDGVGDGDDCCEDSHGSGGGDDDLMVKMT
jgi:hypothetical protein